MVEVGGLRTGELYFSSFLSVLTSSERLLGDDKEVKIRNLRNLSASEAVLLVGEEGGLIE